MEVRPSWPRGLQCGRTKSPEVGETGLRLETRVKSHKRFQNSEIWFKAADLNKASSRLTFNFSNLRIRVHNTNRRKIYEMFGISDSKPDPN